MKVKKAVSGGGPHHTTRSVCVYVSAEIKELRRFGTAQGGGKNYLGHDKHWADNLIIFPDRWAGEQPHTTTCSACSLHRHTVDLLRAVLDLP